MIIGVERMLVRRSNTKTGTVNLFFSAEDAMRIRDLRCFEWKEILVVLRRDRVELYEDYVSVIVRILFYGVRSD